MRRKLWLRRQTSLIRQLTKENARTASKGGNESRRLPLQVSSADATVIAGITDMRLTGKEGRPESKRNGAPPQQPPFPPMKLRLKILQIATPHGTQFQLVMWQKGVSEKTPFVQTVELPKEMM